MRCCTHPSVSFPACPDGSAACCHSLFVSLKKGTSRGLGYVLDELLPTRPELQGPLLDGGPLGISLKGRRVPSRTKSRAPWQDARRGRIRHRDFSLVISFDLLKEGKTEDSCPFWIEVHIERRGMHFGASSPPGWGFNTRGPYLLSYRFRDDHRVAATACLGAYVE